MSPNFLNLDFQSLRAETIELLNQASSLMGQYSDIESKYAELTGRQPRKSRDSKRGSRFSHIPKI